MNKKAQMNIGVILMVAITLVVGVVLFQVVAQEIGSSTNTITVVNDTLGSVDGNAPVYLTSYRAISGVTILNESNGTIGVGGLLGGPVLSTDNYTITNNVIDPTTGGLSVNVTPSPNTIHTSVWKISATSAQPTTYIAEAGGRAVASLVVIFFALAIAVVALTPSLRGEILSMMGK